MQSSRSMPDHGADVRAVVSCEQRPSKKAKITRSPSNCGCILCPEHDRPRCEPNLLSLSDEAVSRIFCYLDASDTSSTFYRPRHAFALALTNTRFLRIFGTHLTHIVPNLDAWSFPTLSHGHMLSVVRIAGLSLREVHLSLKRCMKILPMLPKLCPRVERILLRDDLSDQDGRCEIAKIFALPLQSLSITHPSNRTLRFLPQVPQELHLIGIESEDVTLACKELLRNAPKKLHLHFEDSRRFTDHFRECLYDVCTELEELSLKFFEDEEHMQPPITPHSCMVHLLNLLNRHIRNKRSKCRRMALKGLDALEFFQCAHPEAYVEVSLKMQTFMSHGEGIYPTSIVLLDEYLSQDLSRLTQIYVPSYVHPRWETLLSDTQLERVLVESKENLHLVPLNANVVQMWAEHLSNIDQTSTLDPIEWLHGAKEVCLVGGWGHIRDSAGGTSSSSWSPFLESLARLLDQFPGKRIYLGNTSAHFTIDKNDYVLRSLISFIGDAIDRFEARGGDASTIRSLINDIRRRIA